MTPQRRPRGGSIAALLGALATPWLAGEALAAGGDYGSGSQCDEGARPADTPSIRPAAKTPSKGGLKVRAKPAAARPAPKAARAANDPGDKSGGAAPGDEASDGCEPSLEVTLTFLSAYVFRGLNVFQADRQDEQNWVLKPRVVWSDATSKLEIGYTAAYQLTGNNLWDNVDDGIGSEQVVFADYDFTLAPRLILSPELDAYVYPQSHQVPFFVEPTVELRYEGAIEARGSVSYFGAIRSGPLSEDYLYLSGRVEKSFHVTKKLELEIQAIAGVKFFSAHLGQINDNMFDVLLSESAYYDLNDTFYAGLKLAMAWTNLEPHKDPTTGEALDPHFIDDFAPYWGVVLGAEF